MPVTLITNCSLLQYLNVAKDFTHNWEFKGIKCRIFHIRIAKKEYLECDKKKYGKIINLSLTILIIPEEAQEKVSGCQLH